MKKIFGIVLVAFFFSLIGCVAMARENGTIQTFEGEFEINFINLQYPGWSDIRYGGFWGNKEVIFSLEKKSSNGIPAAEVRGEEEIVVYAFMRGDTSYEYNHDVIYPVTVTGKVARLLILALSFEEEL